MTASSAAWPTDQEVAPARTFLHLLPRLTDTPRHIAAFASALTQRHGRSSFQTAEAHRMRAASNHGIRPGGPESNARPHGLFACSHAGSGRRRVDLACVQGIKYRLWRSPIVSENKEFVRTQRAEGNTTVSIRTSASALTIGQQWKRCLFEAFGGRKRHSKESRGADTRCAVRIELLPCSSKLVLRAVVDFNGERRSATG